MTRLMTVAIATALMLPIVALAALIGEQELRFGDAQRINVPVRGFDPRDPLRGHYITGQFDWDWDIAPSNAAKGGLCILPGDAARPKVRFLENWKPGDRTPDCRLVIAGRVASSAFVPATLDRGTRSVRLYVSETRAPELENLLRTHPGALTVDLAVRSDGSTAIMALRVDGRIVGR
ncbi:MAG: GDYXXLXY domain-containing protein [Enhydrobacter sp.]